MNELCAASLRVLRAAHRLSGGDGQALAQQIAGELLAALGLQACTVDLEALGKATVHAGTMPPPDAVDVVPETHELELAIACEGRSFGSLRLGTFATFSIDDPVREALRVLAEDLAYALRASTRVDPHALPEQLARLQSTSPGVVHTFAVRDGKPTMIAGEGAEELYGFSREQLARDMTPIFERFPPDDRAAVERSIGESGRTMRPWHQTFRYDHPRKGLRWIQGTSVPHHEADGTLAWQGVVRDVTDLQEANDALLESEERFRTIIESIEDVVFRVDSNGACAYLSPAIRRYGYTQEALIGRPFSGLVHPDDLAAMIESFARTLEGAPTVVECRILCADGNFRHARVSSRRINSGSAIVGVAGVLIDVSQQRETESQLRAAQKMEAVGRLAGGVAHDFNNLLSVIGAFAELALDSVRPHDPLHADLSEILKATRRATALTRQLLAFSRKQNLQPQVLEVNELVAGVEKMLRRMIGEDIDLVVVPGADLRRIKADPGQLEQVLMNLVINARDAMPNGGTLTLTTANTRLDGRTAERLGIPLGAYVLVTVTDTGVGMDEAVLRRLFEPFFTTKESGKGTGLGLATAYGIVQQSGGAIAVRSSPGEGATFQIWLPAVDDSVDSEQAPDTSLRGKPSPRAQGTILLVEDEEAVRGLVRRVLVSAGYTVLTASNGGEALLICEDRPHGIDLMLTDVVMPGMSGPALAKRLAPLQPNMRVLFMSGYARDQVDPEMRAEPLLDKPFTVENLVGRVRAMLDAAPPDSRSTPTA